VTLRNKEKFVRKDNWYTFKYHALRRMSLKVLLSWDPITILAASWSRHFFGRKFLGRFVNFSRVFHLSNQLALSGYGLWS